MSDHESRKRTIKNVLMRLGPHVSTDRVVDELQSRGVEASRRLVTQVKMQLLREESRAEREQAKRPPQSKSRNRPQQRKIPRRG